MPSCAQNYLHTYSSVKSQHHVDYMFCACGVFSNKFSHTYRGWHPPPPLHTAYCPILALHTAYLHILALRTVYHPILVLRTAYHPILALRTALIWPCILRTGLFWPCILPYFGFAYCVPPILGIAYCVPFNNKNNHFWHFHLHKEDKTVCCIHNHSCKH